MQLKQVCIYEIAVYHWDNENLEYTENIDSDYYAYTEWVGGHQVLADNCGTPSPNTVYFVYEARTANINIGRGGSIDCFDDVDTATGMNGSPIHEVYFDGNAQVFNPFE